jgi:Ni/Fe-hydrogenase 1 B-type cytochrome subunit
MKEQLMKPYYLFSPELRIFHWVMVMSVVILFLTGLYIGNPAYIGAQGTEPTFAVSSFFSMENIRFIHFATAFVLLAALILRIFGFVTNKGDRLFPKPWTRDYWSRTADMALHYTFFRSTHRPYLRNHLARSGYATVYIMLFIEAVTGLAMYFMINPNGWGAALFGPVNYWLKSEYTVHLVHHYIAWFFVLFVIVHLYMVIRDDLRERNGEISSMISGVKYLHEDPDDIGDIK